MKSLLLLILSAAIPPSCALISRGAMRESWALLSFAGALLALVMGLIHYLLGA